MRSKTEIQINADSYIASFNSFLSQQDPSGMENLSLLIETVNSFIGKLKSIDEKNVEEINLLEEVISPLIKEIKEEIIALIKHQTHHQASAKNVKEKLPKSNAPFSIEDFSSLIEEYNNFLNPNAKLQEDAKLIIEDVPKYIQLFSDLPIDLSNPIKAITKLNEALKRIDSKQIRELKAAHQQLSLVIRSAQTEMMEYFLKQANDNKATAYIKKLEEYQEIFNQTRFTRLAPETMVSLIEEFKKIVHYAMQIESATALDNSPTPSATISVIKTASDKKRKPRRTTITFQGDPPPDADIIKRREKVVLVSEPTKTTSPSYQEQVDTIDADTAEVNQKLQKLDAKNKGRELALNAYNDRVIKDQQDKIKKIHEKIAVLNRERSPYKLYLKILLSRILSDSEQREIKELKEKESIASQIGDTVKSIIPSQQETLSNITQFLGIAKSLNDVKREFSTSHHGATVESLIVKETEYLEKLTQLCNEAEQESERINQRINEIHHQEILSSLPATRVEEKYKELVEQEGPLSKSEEEYKALYEQKAELAKAEKEYNALCKNFNETFLTTKELPSAPVGAKLTELSSTLNSLRADQNLAVINVGTRIEELSKIPMLQIDELKARATTFQSEISLLNDRLNILHDHIEKYNGAVDAVLNERTQFNQECVDALQAVKDLFEKTQPHAKAYGLSENDLDNIKLQISKAEKLGKFLLTQYNAYPQPLIYDSKKRDYLSLLAMVKFDLEAKLSAGNGAFLQKAVELQKNLSILREKVKNNSNLLKLTPNELAHAEECLNKIETTLKGVARPQVKDLSNPFRLDFQKLTRLDRQLGEQNLAIDEAIEKAKQIKKASMVQNRTRPSVSANLIQKNSEKILNRQASITPAPLEQKTVKPSTEAHPVIIQPVRKSEPQTTPSFAKGNHGSDSAVQEDIKSMLEKLGKEEATSRSLDDEIASAAQTLQTPTVIEIAANKVSESENAPIEEVQIIKTMIDKIAKEIERIKEFDNNDLRIPILQCMKDELGELANSPPNSSDDFITFSIKSISQALRSEQSNYHRLSTEVADSLNNFINWLLRPITWGIKAWKGETYRARFFPDFSETVVANAAEEAHKSLRQLQQQRLESKVSQDEDNNSDAKLPLIS
ncbi:hypothetical protein [Legionella drozanskii]|uniref:Uncharacterized protein n=1 Tax=Legionella drozanskii LLAP-1 TaxID=1212489 RepID=A0A0W0SRH8_9GAMM|nr:hypothetical protein [Legionella drozanskii]KTC85891.1 hypothetical protein Ldro_2216 [Legionella drozanskii LLAP-1]